MIYSGEKIRDESIDERERHIFFIMFLFVVNILQGKYLSPKKQTKTAKSS